MSQPDCTKLTEEVFDEIVDETMDEIETSTTPLEGCISWSLGRVSQPSRGQRTCICAMHPQIGISHIFHQYPIHRKTMPIVNRHSLHAACHLDIPTVLIGGLQTPKRSSPPRLAQGAPRRGTQSYVLRTPSANPRRPFLTPDSVTAPFLKTPPNQQNHQHFFFFCPPRFARRLLLRHQFPLLLLLPPARHHPPPPK